MLTSIILAFAVPAVAAMAFLALRGRLPRLASDVRGIALQTVIILVVLLAIAGGVSAVLLTAGGEAVDDLDNQQVTRKAGDYKNETLCKAAGFTWANNACT